MRKSQPDSPVSLTGEVLAVVFMPSSTGNL